MIERFDEGMGRVDPEVGEHIERSKPYRNPHLVKDCGWYMHLRHHFFIAVLIIYVTRTSA